jgi:hypothetical protein
MGKIIFQDMVVKKPIGTKKKNEISLNIPDLNKKERKPNKDPVENVYSDLDVSPRKKKGKYYLWVVALISATFCFFALSLLFSSAKITVYPKIKEIKLNKNFSAEKNTDNTNLALNLVVVEGTETSNIIATEEKEISNKATGVAIIYNAFSTSSQILSIDTRLEGSNGKIYKTEKRIIVPGMKKDGTPGSVEIGIYASLPGEEFNSGPLDFKIVGFEGTPKYEKFYGRSLGEITGGFVGKTLVLSEEEKTAAINSLVNSLKEKLLKKASAPGFVLFKDAVFFKTDEVGMPLKAENGKVSISVKGTLKGILLDEEKLIQKVAESGIDKYDGSKVYISDFGNLIFSLSDDAIISLNDTNNINFNLSGNVNVVYILDVDKFVSDLSGESKDNFGKILSQYGSVESAILRLRFPWMQNIPEEKEDINVIINYPK